MPHWNLEIGQATRTRIIDQGKGSFRTCTSEAKHYMGRKGEAECVVISSENGAIRFLEWTLIARRNDIFSNTFAPSDQNVS